MPNGIRYTNNGKKYFAAYGGEHLGVYKTLEEAYSVYVEKKEDAIKKMADKYKDYIPDRVYRALCEYKVRMENDKNYKAS